jgi:pimeloyl-ACP methyl ester carboxylesterase
MNAEGLHTILVPGLCCTARVYESVYTDVWAYGPVTIADTRRDNTIPAIAERVLADAPERFALAGYSMGGYIAFEVVRQAPDRVLALALISTAASPDTPDQAAARRQQLELTRNGKFDQLVDAAFAVLPSAANSNRHDLAAFWSEMAHEVGPDAFCAQLQAVTGRADSRPLLANIKCLTTVIHGADDQLIPVEHAHRTASAIPHATRVIIDGAGHMLPQEQPDAIRGAVRAWLRQAVT